ncbi:MAG: hypothetical protein ACRDBO_00110 [Lachnospiraceae bacterium]
MLQEMELNKALKAFAAGRKVKVLQPATDDPKDENYLFSDLADWLKGCRLLVDVPATTNPDFDEATQDMTEANLPKGKGKPGPKPIDTGKIQALHKSGKSVKWIADDMGISVSTVSKYIQREV